MRVGSLARKLGIAVTVFAVGVLVGQVRASSQVERSSAAAPTSSYRIQATATAYCLHGRTASGTAVRRGTVAVDPSVIPLGSRLRVSGYGSGRALDTGSAVRGRIVDLWMPTCAEAIRWGRRPVVVTVYR